jgi:molybdopterin-guanine dinucleotide biosynthesis protein
MAIIIVGGSGRNVGKTTLVCALVAAMPEFRWTAVKISAHEHGHPEPVWEESASGEHTDSERYLAAGAQRALLVTAAEGDFPIEQIRAALAQDDHVIFESNRIADYYKPDLCLAVLGFPEGDRKPSFDALATRADAFVALEIADAKAFALPPDGVVLPLVDFQAMPPELLLWLRERLRHPLRHPRI